MRKEILIAVIAGIAVGLAVAFGAWRANSAFMLRQKQNTSPSTQNTNGAITNQNTNSGLLISLVNLENYDVFTQTPIKVSGITEPNSIVVISGENQDYAIKSDENGAFEQDVDLTGGINQILFSVSDSKGKVAEQNVTVVYSSEFANSLNQ